MAEPVTIFTPPKSAPANAAAATPQFRTSRVLPASAVEGVRSDPPVSEPQRRWLADQAELTRQDPWRDPNVVISKNPDGTLSMRPRDGGQQTATPDAGAQPGQQPQPGPASSDGTTLKIGDLSLGEAEVGGLLERKSFEDSRRATMPASPDQYDLSLPSDFALPPGVGEWQWDLESPTSAALLGQAKEFAHAHGLDQPAFSKMLGLYASHALAEEGRFAELQKAERGKLGANISGRVDAVNTWLESQVGSDLAKALRTTMFTAKSVEAYERLMRNHISQGVGGHPAGGRDPGADRPGRLTDAQYEALSFHERVLYTQRMSQGGG